MATTTRVPTVDDLRLKLCYICREEELYDAPENPRRQWTHPCKCTLVAHEQCLLKWIQTAQATEGRAQNAMKCPQCGAAYELESKNPFILRLINVGNNILQSSGGMFTLFGTATVIGVVGTSIYVVCTGYGAWAMQKFIGKEMFNFLLGDDPSQWPWSAFINLPLLPFSLIVTRFQSTSSLPPIIPILLALPSTFSPAFNQKINDHWRLDKGMRKLTSYRSSSSPASTSSPRSWPPSPMIFGLFGIPLVQMVYQRLYSKVYFKVMGTLPPERVALLRNRDANGGAAGRNNVARMDIANGPFNLRVRANLRDDPHPAAHGEPDLLVGQDIPAPEEERVLQVNASTVGRKVAGALLTPAIASWMGTLLLRFSRHSVLLREFLAIRRPIGRVWYPPPVDVMNKDMHTLSAFKQMTVGFQMIARGLWGSSRTFLESDPVWWRNTVGLGLFIVVKDAVQLFHLWLTKRELESRKVKNRDFTGVDFRELDLIPSFLLGTRR
ncbi:hypothetical protein DFP72DRAFT_910711 [Ephemerocybe angulata]|uniref:RING-CH-type domain-containing protein n=1 Tax=Ephemerocybe angulata TaxID=980116 RepID=A0A8H6M2Y5_9AGAR|nr:hypothetical protein DFP72DRAFT_910711 [Tulosesus angulatus]